MRPSRVSIAALTVLAASLLVVPAPAGADASTALGDPFPGFVRLQGDLDPSVTGNARVSALGVQSSGKIIVAEHAGDGAWLHRLNPDGTLDRSWGTQGRVHAGAHPIGELLVLPDDRVAIAVQSVSVYTVNGRLDPAFGIDGVAPIALDPGYTVSWAQELLRQPDGRLVVVGETRYGSSDWDVFATRFHADGTPDPSFRHRRSAYFSDEDGVSDNTTVGALAGAGGSYHLIGRTGQFPSLLQPRSWQLQPDPALDGPPVSLPLPAGGSPTLVPGEQPGTGYLLGTSATQAYVARLKVTASGVRLDTAWGASGVQAGSWDTFAMAGAVQPDGKLVLATKEGLVRRNLDGTIDPTFRLAPPQPGTNESDTTGVDLTPDGGILRAGWERVGTSGHTPFVEKLVGRLAHVSTTVTHTPAPALSQSATVTYRNAGPDAAEGARVLVEAPAAMGSRLSPSQGACTAVDAGWTCALGNVSAGSQVTIQVALTSTTPATGTLTATGSTTTYDAYAADQRSSVAIATTAPPVAAPPAPPPGTSTFTVLRRPVIKGTARVGRTLKATNGRWSPTPTRYRYRWLRNGKAIKRATARTYRVTARDAGKRIVVRVTALRVDHRSGVATSRGVRIRGRDHGATGSRPGRDRVAS